MIEKNKIIKLRPHHGLCIRFYTGKGYNEKFVCAMNEVAAILNNPKKDIMINIILVKGEDILCSHCPGCVGDAATRYDKLVLEYTGLSYGDNLSREKFNDIITKTIFEKNLFDNICSDCIWSKICRGS